MKKKELLKWKVNFSYKFHKSLDKLQKRIDNVFKDKLKENL